MPTLYDGYTLHVGMILHVLDVVPFLCNCPGCNLLTPNKSDNERTRS